MSFRFQKYFKENKNKKRTIVNRYKQNKKYRSNLKKTNKKKTNKIKRKYKKRGGGSPRDLSKEAIAVASLTETKSNIPNSFIEGLNEQYGPELDALKDQLKNKLDIVAVMIKEVAQQSESWDSQENENNIQKIKENLITQIDKVGIPVAASVAKLAGASAGTVVKELMMTSGVAEVIAAMRLCLTTISTVIELVNKLGITEKMAPLVSITIGKISDIISTFGNTKKNMEFQVKKGDEITKTVTDQKIEVTNTNTGIKKNIKIETNPDGNIFSVK